MWLVMGRDLEEATERAKKVVGGSSFTLEQDEDVLDTKSFDAFRALTQISQPHVF
jgi:hypothetical protein